MEQYNNKLKDKIEIVSISKSEETFKPSPDIKSDGLSLSLSPYLIVDRKNQQCSIVLSGAFMLDKTPVSNEFKVNTVFSVHDLYPVKKSEDGIISIDSPEVFTSMMDTAVGTFRGLFSDWLSGSEYRKPVPFVNIAELIKTTRICFDE